MRIAQRLAMVVLLAMMPLVVLEAVGVQAERREEHIEARAVAMRTAHRAAAEQERIVEGARQLLTALSQIPAVQRHETERCNLILSRLQAQLQMYLAIGVADRSGRVWCSSTEPGTDISDRAYFKNAVATRQFSTGGYIVGRVRGMPSLNFSTALIGSDGSVDGVLIAALDLDRLANGLKRTSLPPAAALAIAGPDRRLLVTLPDDGRVGTTLPSQFDQAFSAKRPGLLEAPWFDGSKRIVAFVPPGSYADLPFIVLIGSEKDAVMKDVEARTRLRMLVLAATVGIALLLTWSFATRFVSRPMLRVTNAVLAWQRGDRAARVGLIGDGSEFDDLARVYDELAAGYDERQRRLRDALESTSDSVMTLAPDWTIAFLNERARARLDGLDAIGRGFWEVFPDVEAGWIGNSLRTAMIERRPLSLNIAYPRLDGHFQINALPLDDGSLMFFIRDVTEQHRAETELRTLALSDSLTGLPNRANAMNLARLKLAEGRLAALLLIDLDGFKHVNDSFGHPVGDELLRQVADRLSASSGGSNVIGRLGGDEFIALVDRDDDHAEEQGERLLKALAHRSFQIGERTLHVMASCGEMFVPTDAPSTVEELLANADLALYRAKGAGAGRTHRYTAADRDAYEKRRTLEEEIERAVAQGEFELLYQPQVRLSDGALMGAEALLRWRHPERGLLSPDDFLDVLSGGRHAATVGAWVLDEVCRQAASWWRAGNRIRVAVNLFSEQVRGNRLAASVRQALTAHALPPQALEIELTEAVALSTDSTVRENLLALRVLGVWLALDDFGTGFASLTTLKDIRVDRLKIDRGFVAQLPYNDHDLAIVEAVLAMARTLGLEVIAEGVETEVQEAYLRSRGCHEAQGFRYARPLPATDLERFMRDDDRKMRAAV